MKPPKLALAIPSLIILAASLGTAEIVERVIAKVNGDVVTLSEFQARQLAAVQAARISPAKVEVFLRENNARILQEAVDDLLLVQRAAELSIRLRPEYIKELIEGIKKDNKIDSDEALQEQLRREGMTLDDLKRNIERSILRRQVLQREVESKTTLTEADARADYEAHKTDYAKAPTVTLQEILIAAKDGQDAAALAREVVTRARAGEDFAALARAHSTGPTAKSGGDLGQLTHDDMTPEVQKVASSLAPGAVSDPLPAGSGVRILRVAAKTPAHVVPFEEVKAQIRERLSQERTSQEYTRYLEGLRKNAILDMKVREVPLQVNVPTGPSLDTTTPGAGAAEGKPSEGAAAPEVSVSPQTAPERVAPAALPSPKPTPSPQP